MISTTMQSSGLSDSWVEKVYYDRDKLFESWRRAAILSEQEARWWSDELLRRNLHLDPAAQLLVFVPKPDGSLIHITDPLLCDGRPPDVATGISEEVFFGLEGLDLDASSPFFDRSGGRVPNLDPGRNQSNEISNEIRCWTRKAGE